MVNVIGVVAVFLLAINKDLIYLEFTLEYIGRVGKLRCRIVGNVDK